MHQSGKAKNKTKEDKENKGKKDKKEKKKKKKKKVKPEALREGRSMSHNGR